MLKFSFSNSKIKSLALHLNLKKIQVACFDLPAGWTCPKADICRTLVDKKTGLRVKRSDIVCYASKAESYAPAVRRLRWHNFDQLVNARTIGKMSNLILSSIPNTVKIIRIHSSGDFFNENYFQAWLNVAIMRPDILIFGYTKILNYALFEKPSNFILQYSYGGLDDSRRDDIGNVPTCYINTPDKTYPVKVVCDSRDNDYQDYESILAGESFAINVH